MLTYISHGSPLYLTLYAALIIFFAFFYTSIIFNPEETADNLKKYGGFIPGIRPGQEDGRIYRLYVLTRITVIGALYLALVCLIPEWLIFAYSISLLPRRHLDPDRRQRHDGHRGPDPEPSGRPAI